MWAVAPEMRVAPIYRQYSQPLPQPAMIYRSQPLYYNRVLYRRDRPCCTDICDRCCDDCCGCVLSSFLRVWCMLSLTRGDGLVPSAVASRPFTEEHTICSSNAVILDVIFITHLIPAPHAVLSEASSGPGDSVPFRHPACFVVAAASPLSPNRVHVRSHNAYSLSDFSRSTSHATERWRSNSKLICHIHYLPI